MPRPKSLDPRVSLHTTIPASLHAKLSLLLWSEMEGRVPAGAYQEFICSRIREFFEWRKLDLSPFGYPPGFFLSGPKEMVEEIEKRMKV